MNIDILNAYCGIGSLPVPRLSQGRLTSYRALRSGFAAAAAGEERVRPGPSQRASLAPSPQVQTGSPCGRRPRVRRGRGIAPRSGRTVARCSLRASAPCRCLARAVSSWGTCGPPSRAAEACTLCVSNILLCRPEIRRDYPLNLSISLSGGKETNKDSPSNGE